jgi:molecular chaperone GrpE
MPLISPVLPSSSDRRPLQRYRLRIHFNGWQTYPLTQSRYEIGRSPQCSICIKHDRISRLHAILEQTEDGKIKLMDGDGTNRSRNGTFVNGARISDCWLKVGDMIHFGDTDVMARLESICIEKDPAQPVSLKVNSQDNAKYPDLPDLEPELEDDSATSFDPQLQSSATPAGSDSASPLPTEHLTATINKLYYEIGLLEQQLKERKKSYESLLQELDHYRRSTPINHDQELLSLKEQLKKGQESYDLLRQEFDEYRRSTKAKLELATSMMSQVRNHQARLSSESSDNMLFNKQSVYEILLREKQKIMLEILPITDYFELAQKQIKPTTEAEKKIHYGYQSIYRLFEDALKKIGLTRITTTQQLFDPNVHEAVACKSTSDYPEGTILVENQAVFMLGNKVIRPAKVIVATSES